MGRNPLFGNATSLASADHVCNLHASCPTSTSFLSNETAKQLRLVVFLPVPPEFLNPTIPVYHYRAVFHGRCQKVFRPSVMPYIRMETTQCIVEDLLAKLMSSFVSARACRSAFMGILHTSACVGSFASPWPFARKSGPCLEHKKAEVQAAQIAYVPETEKNPWKRGWFCLDASIIELAYCLGLSKRMGVTSLCCNSLLGKVIITLCGIPRIFQVKGYTKHLRQMKKK